MQPAAKYLYHVTWGLSAAIVTVHTIQDAWHGVQRYLCLACGYKQGPPGFRRRML